MKEYNGTLNTKVWSIIPILLFFSLSTITNKDGSRGGRVFAIHVLFFFVFGIPLKG